ncbi:MULTISPECIES: hypothetical protein [Paenibacillus]|uniref:Uncharacterized protein n=2 Tax=Paenibacillus TaxID=44249 RepID=A0ABX2ZAD5_PAEPO|nr:MULTISPECIES: hypothetical protein [Paenibacillus]MDR6779402.1 hypothetical protein [Paenibacillus peoriae]ODA08298.1 hypothetical protein A7312_27565 [Paenibacillus polymyxa]
MDITRELKDQIRSSYIDINDIAPHEAQIAAIINLIPDRIKTLAEEWGWNDTEVRDFIYVLIRDNKEKFQ